MEKFHDAAELRASCEKDPQIFGVILRSSYQIAIISELQKM
jgi:hypothetical protein